MPAIMLAIEFNRMLCDNWQEEQIVDFISERFPRLEPPQQEDLLQDLFTLRPEAKRAIQDQIIASFRFGTLGDPRIAMLRSWPPECIEFWIYSENLENCLKGRKWIIKRSPHIRQRTRRKIVTDALHIEGANEIPKENMVTSYALKNSLNGGLLVNFIVVLARTLDDYRRFNSFDASLPLLVLAIWISILIPTIFYYRRKVAYIVREKN
jgi:hypothetical protein